jgi:hypothetical protein
MPLFRTTLPRKALLDEKSIGLEWNGDRGRIKTMGAREDSTGLIDQEKHQITIND